MFERTVANGGIDEQGVRVTRARINDGIRAYRNGIRELDIQIREAQARDDSLKVVLLKAHQMEQKFALIKFRGLSRCIRGRM